MIQYEKIKSASWDMANTFAEKIKLLDRKQKMILAFILVIIFILPVVFLNFQKNKDQSPSVVMDVDEMLSNEKAEIENKETISGSNSDVFLKLLKSFSGLSVTSLDGDGSVSLRASQVIKVPSEADTIQKAINAALEGDVILVAAGEYKENIVMKNGVSVIGENAEATILDGQKMGNVVTFKGISDQNNSRLENFTIKNAQENLGGIFIEDSSPIINRNIILQNDYDIYIKGESSPVLQRNRLSESKAAIQIFNLSDVQNSNPLILDNVIFGNKKGINVYHGNATIEHNTISFNSAYGIDAGATFGIYMTSASALIKNNIITDNGTCEICSGIYIDDKSQNVSISSNDLWNNQSNFVCFGGCSMEENNRSEDPMFANGLLFDFNLKAESPVLSAGSDGQKLGARL